MYYEINVSQKGRHLFATSDHSLTSMSELDRVLPLIVERFPKEEGFSIGITHWQTQGESLGVADILTSKYTGFSYFQDLLDAPGDYRPTLDMRKPGLKALADNYDEVQEARQDPRRAYRVGED